MTPDGPTGCLVSGGRLYYPSSRGDPPTMTTAQPLVIRAEPVTRTSVAWELESPSLVGGRGRRPHGKDCRAELDGFA